MKPELSAGSPRASCAVASPRRLQDLTDLEGKTGKFAVACWAGEVRVVRASEQYVALLRVDIARRDPPTAEVLSPLAGGG